MTTRPVRHSIPADILALSHERDVLRKRGQYDRADALKKLIEEAGYSIKDNPHGAHLVILPSVEVDEISYRTARHVPSLLNERERYLFSVQILANNRFAEVRRCVESIFHCAGDLAIEVIVVDNASQDDLAAWLREFRQDTTSLHVIHTSRVAGEAEARNLGLKQSCGRFILQLAPHIELTGDIFTPLATLLSKSEIGIAGPRGLRTDDLRHFEKSNEELVDAIDGSCMAFRRDLLNNVGMFDERYRFPDYMDIDFNFAVRDSEVNAVVIPDLPLISHPTHPDEALSDAERSRLNKRNFYRFLEKWGDREDLLLDTFDEEEE